MDSQSRGSVGVGIEGKLLIGLDTVGKLHFGYRREQAGEVWLVWTGWKAEEQQSDFLGSYYTASIVTI